jgi:methylmalonyl-CoA mutase cobalamin-binding domain/chain
MQMIRKLEDAIINLDVEGATNVCKELIESSKVGTDEIFKSMRRALDVVGQKYEEKEYFLSELIMVGEVVKEVLKLIEPIYKRDEQAVVATVVLATVRGDLHDLGKNTFAMLLRSSGFRVVDLGIDVTAENIAKAVKENKAEILGLSALLTTTVPEIENVVEELRKSSIREKVRVLVGGAAVNEEVVEKYGGDAWGKTAVEGLKICKQWYS